jgi:transketolase
MAISEAYLASRFNRPGHTIVDHYTYAIVSDGDLMEGVSHEAASLAGHLGLGKLIYLYDDNRISIEGSTDLAFTESRIARFEAYGWHVQQVDNGNDLERIEQAIAAAQKEIDRPSLIAVRTHIGYGSPNKQDTAEVHGEPLGAEEVRLTKENLGWPLEPAFLIPDKALNNFRKSVDKGKALEAEWQQRFKDYEAAYRQPALEWRRWMTGETPKKWKESIPVFSSDSKGMATRAASGNVLNAIAGHLPNLIGGSADLAPSNKTMIQGESGFQARQYGGRNLHFGVREHAMGSILNGMALHGGLIPYGGTFLVFSDYMRPAIRLAALMKLKVIYVFTHDSIGLGEDGPTHQPIEHLSALRAIPNLTVIRPCDANETATAWQHAIDCQNGPVALVLSRQGLPTLDRAACAPATGLVKGAYVLQDTEKKNLDVIFIATGSEVSLALEAFSRLQEQGVAVRLVSMPSWELFEMQSEDYRRQVLPSEVKARIAVEAGCPLGWHRYVGEHGAVIGIDHFGASAPYKRIYENFGLTVDRLIAAANQLLGR